MLQVLSRILLFSFCFVFALAGCGGGGGGGPKRATPKVAVAWPERSRTLAAPSSALSVRVVLDPVANGQANVTILGDRSGNLQAHTATYTASTEARTGEYGLQATFYDAAGGTGDVVGTAAATVRLQRNGELTKPDGSPLGTIGFTGTIKTVTLAPNQTVKVGDELTLVPAAADEAGNPVVVSPGSFVFTVTGGGSNLSVTKDGVATGLAVGTATVTVSVDGVTSSPTTITVLAENPVVTLVDLRAQDLFYDTTRNTVWVAVASDDPPQLTRVVPIDATTGAVGTAIITGNQPRTVAVSENGQYLFAGGNDGTIKRVVLATGQIDLTIEGPEGSVPRELIPLPGRPTSFVVTRSANDGSNADLGTTIYDGAVPRNNSAHLGLSVVLAPSGERIYGYTYLGFDNAYRAARISDLGITVEMTNDGALSGFGNRIHWANGKILADDGKILEPDSGTLLGQLEFNTVDHVAAPVPGQDKAHYMAWDPTTKVQTYNLTTRERTLDFPVPGVAGGINQAIWAGPGRIAFYNFGEAPPKVGIVSSLP